MQRHEAMCFRNSERKCPCCDNNPEHKPSIQRFIEEHGTGKHVQSNGYECPVCLMAMLIQHNKPSNDGEFIRYELDQFRKDRSHFLSEIADRSWRDADEAYGRMTSAIKAMR